MYDDAVVCWRGEKMSQWKRELMHLAPHVDSLSTAHIANLPKLRRTSSVAWQQFMGRYRRFFPYDRRKSIQDTIQGDACTLQRQDDLSGMPWGKVAQRSDVCEKSMA